MGAFTQKVYQIVQKIPRGSVATYGQVAALAGNPRTSRIVGCAMHHAPKGIPCHRVVFQDGSLCKDDIFGGRAIQRGILEQEGVCF